MNRQLWDLVLLAGVLCFVIGAAGLISGYLTLPSEAALSVLGLILVGAGASGKRRSG